MLFSEEELLCMYDYRLVLTGKPLSFGILQPNCLAGILLTALMYYTISYCVFEILQSLIHAKIDIYPVSIGFDLVISIIYRVRSICSCSPGL